MTIQRQYSSPSCQLILQGLTDGAGNFSDKSACMSMLMNAECKFVNMAQSLKGGRNFFDALVQQVSQYAQTVLSDVHRPTPATDPAALVSLHQIEDNVHRLTVRTDKDGEVEATAGSSSPIQLDLTTVQLFDLVEAIDQFFADPRTLPDLIPDLQPVPRRQVRPEQPVAQRTVPAALGVSGLALAAFGFLALPIPEVEPPGSLLPESRTEVGLETGGTEGLTGEPPQATDPNVPEGLQSTLNSSPTITDGQTISRLQAKLDEDLAQAWVFTPAFTRELIYRVSMAADGRIMDYQLISEAGETEERLVPLAGLKYQTPENAEIQEPLADFRVVFKPTGRIEVRPWGNE
ncbi:MAG: DUF4335 domain-containing protein [Microcoleaceae cyanobacterium]